MNLYGHTHKSTNVGGYKYDFEGFYKKFIHPKSINKRRRVTTKRANANLVGYSPCSSLSLLVKNIQKEIPFSCNHVDIVRG